MSLEQVLANIKASLPKEILEAPAQSFAVTFGNSWLDTLEAMPEDRRNT